MKKKVLLGLSGGVDSAIAAHKLLEMGYEVTGAFMRNWDAITNNDILGNPTLNNNQCPQEADYWDAVAVAKKLNIPLIRIDYVKEYWDEVFVYFLDEYKKGRTPNPDILCNSEIKFGPFLKYAMDNGFDYISMGHYAKKVEKDGHYYVSKPLDKAKDQTYFLCALNEEQIEKCLWPMEDITKVEAREIATKLGLDEVSTKHGSTGVCFIGERNFREFLKNYFPAQSGDIVDIENGRVLGKHIGVLYYTIGQRKGLGIGGIKGEPDTAWFVAKKDVVKNIFKQKDTSPLVLMATVYIPQDAEINEICLEDSAILTCDTPLRTKQNFKIEATETSSAKGLEIVSSSLTVKTEKKSSVIADADSPEISINTKNSSIADLTVKAKNVNVESDNFSQLTLSGVTTEARLRSSGSSKLAVKTTTENFFVSAKGSSVIDATEGVITNADVELTGADCKVNPLKTLTLSVTSNAELVFDGTPVITIKKITNSTVIPASEVKKKK